jgi:glycosyltransferase involved in cell wall biosynthesis
LRIQSVRQQSRLAFRAAGGLVPDSAAAMAAAVVRLAADDRLRVRLASSAREFVSRNYSRDAVIPLIREFFAAAQRRSQVQVLPD